MTLPAGARLGPYEITSAIGAGGMGEVYRARDTRLGRTVAIKILPEAFASDQRLRLRFEREAKSISQLSHPHICTLHDVGQATVGTDSEPTGVDPASTVHYLVMEYLDGENLAARLLRGRLTLEESVRLGTELASALDCAHRSGVVHRDLKPANVILTRGGAKLVDFGLARIGLSSGSSEHEATMRRDPAAPLTEEGAILGTPQYMAPEQVSGEEADARADIFALGAILYELLSGRKAFTGTSKASLMAAILTSEPQPLRELHPQIPLALEQLVRAMMARDREQRVQTAHDVRLQLQWILDSLSQPGGQAVAPVARSSRRGVTLAVAIAVVTILAAIAALAMLRSAPVAVPPPLIRFAVPPPNDHGYDFGLLALSPDGRQIAYGMSTLGGPSSLWLRILDRDEPRRLARTEGAYNPFFSPDGRWLGFFSGTYLRRINLDDLTVESICEARGFGGASWGRNNVILFSPTYEGEIWRVDVAVGIPSRETEVTGDSLHIWPHFLPDGDLYLYQFWNPEGGGVMARRLGSSEETMVLPIGTIDEMTVSRYASGRLFFVRDHLLFAQPFDAKTLTLSGNPRRVAEGLKYHGPGLAPFAVSASGTAVYLPDGSNLESELLIVDKRGNVLQRVGEPAAISGFSVSPGGELVAAEIDEPLKKQSLWLIDVARGSRSPAVEGWAGSPVWLPDGSGFVFSAVRDSPPNVHRVSLGREVERISRSAGQQHPTSITPDGLIVYQTIVSGAQRDIRIMQPDGSDDVPLLSSKSDAIFDSEGGSEGGGTVSPDGRWLAFVTNESGRDEVYITAFPRPERRWQVSADGGRRPRWGRDGRELYFLSRGRLMRARISATDRIDAGVPDHLFDIPVAAFDTMPGDRFLIARRHLSPSRPPLRVISGWQHLTAD
jgi:eukaryotic-like serine/threonine-protein kinase